MFCNEYKEISFSDIADNSYYRIHGRTEADENGLRLSWSNSGIEFLFNGNRAELHFGESFADQPYYVKVFIDKGQQKYCIDGKSPKILLDCQRNTCHHVKALLITENNSPLLLKKIRIYGKTPEFLPKPEDKKLKLEFMGDSITAGFGVVAAKDQDTFYTYEEDSTQTYAFLTAEKLDADLRTICVSGQGVWKNCAGETGYRFEKIFDMSLRAKDGYDHSAWQPDVMILNCGTNDVPGKTTEEIMYTEGSALIDKVRKAYPKAHIIWMYGMMNSKFTETLDRLVADKRREGDDKIHFLHVDEIYSQKNEVGAIGHPNVNASVRVSGILSRYIANLLKSER